MARQAVGTEIDPLANLWTAAVVVDPRVDVDPASVRGHGRAADDFAVGYRDVTLGGRRGCAGDAETEREPEANRARDLTPRISTQRS